VSLVLLFGISTILEFGCRDASACQCVVRRPEIYEESDAIFIGKITKIDRYHPLENTRYITFDVSRSWKGVETESITIHSDNNECAGMVAIMGQEYLIYAKNKDLLKIDVGCGGSIATDGGSSNEEFVARDIKYLDTLYETVTLREGHTTSVNIFPPLQILGSFIVLAIGAFVFLRRR
jgi:hypothetical protein